jgi:acyl transferase domain-containing protein
MTPAIAIVGMAFKLPGGDDDVAFTEVLAHGRVNGRGLIRPPPPDRWPFYRVGPPNDLAQSPGIRMGGYIDGAFEFDPRVFSLSPREARLVDPQHRMVLEMALFAQEDAGYGGGMLAETRTGVFVGSSRTDYLDMIAAYLGPDDYAAGVANARAVLSNRVSSVFNFTGPSVTVDSLCSSSLLAVHAAVRSLGVGDCDVALAGGINFLMSPYFLFVLSRLRQLSPTNESRPFDLAADGFVPGEGGAMFCLKRLSDAVAAGDPIRAIIIGASVVHHGHSDGLTVPNPAAMAQVIAGALKDAGLEPSAIGMLQAMGASNRLGDQAELQAVQAVFSAAPRAQPLPVTCDKGTIGHLEAASGVAGLVAAVRALEEKTLFPLHRGGNSQGYPDVPGVRFMTHAESWHAYAPRRASINSFGMTGTHVNLVIEEAPPLAASDDAAEWHVLPVSADSADSLSLQAAAYAAALSGMSENTIADACFTAGTGRRHGQFRTAIVSNTGRGLVDGLSALTSGGPCSNPNSTVIRGTLGAPIYGFPWRRAVNGEAPRRSRIDRATCEAAAQAFANGEPVDWNMLQTSRRRRVQIPKTRFERRTYVVEPDDRNASGPSASAPARTPTHPLLGGARRA